MDEEEVKRMRQEDILEEQAEREKINTIALLTSAWISRLDINTGKPSQVIALAIETYREIKRRVLNDDDL